MLGKELTSHDFKYSNYYFKQMVNFMFLFQEAPVQQQRAQQDQKQSNIIYQYQ